MSISTFIAVLMSITFMMLPPAVDPDRSPVIYYIRFAWLGASILALLFLLFHVLRKAGRLKWGDDSLLVRSRSIAAKEIKVICIDGPLVGILPIGKRIVPVNLCFRFMDNREQAMKQLILWAEANEIKLKYKRFVKWM
ncbi:hypothetical protein [Paenibacillus sp. MMS20-IR301]|uniref:hypothetical protein n=1 Tax=Paenibacillus sp. MMS20-IR301 TaxID=2895946 RepID=UPI0028E3D9E2|nr:hypothetical protein [Paenibacillus sp. MMS20-IR301]WNS45915.1 hypothetical protein LOS79_11785 [Paenibacillus sp. MMS20-IR301]